MSSNKQGQKYIILRPIPEFEELADACVDVHDYKYTFFRCHNDLKIMRIGQDSLGDFQSNKKLKNVVLNTQSFYDWAFKREKLNYLILNTIYISIESSNYNF